MKREFVRALLKGVEGAEDIVSQIMDANGADIESAKEAGAASIDLTKFVPTEEHEALKVEYDKRADYDDLKTQVENHALEKETNLKLEHLKELGPPWVNFSIYRGTNGQRRDKKFKITKNHLISEKIWY